MLCPTPILRDEKNVNYNWRVRHDKALRFVSSTCLWVTYADVAMVVMDKS